MDRITPRVTITDIRTVRQADTSVFDAIITVCQENVRDSITDDSVVYSQHELADGVRDEVRGGECTFAVFETAADDLRESLIVSQQRSCQSFTGKRSVIHWNKFSVNASVQDQLQGYGIMRSCTHTFTVTSNLLMISHLNTGHRNSLGSPSRLVQFMSSWCVLRHVCVWLVSN